MNRRLSEGQWGLSRLTIGLTSPCRASGAAVLSLVSRVLNDLGG